MESGRSASAKWVNVDYSTPPPAPSYSGHDGHDAGSPDHDHDSGFSTPGSSQYNLHQQLPFHAYSHVLSSGSAIDGDDSNSGNESFIQVTVSEPVKQGEGMNAYISYKITTTTNRPQFSKASMAVVRRYSDFVWLHASLSAKYPGVIVPPLPEKLLVGRFSPEFVESRRRALQLFLHRCCCHPELQHSEHLTTFLEAQDDALQAFKADPKNTPNKTGRGSLLFQWIDETVSTISTTLGSATTNIIGINHYQFDGASSVLEKTAADLEVEELIAYVDGLEPIMTGLHKHAHGLTKRAREIADALFEFGVAFTLLGKSEENASLQEGLAHIGACSDKLAVLAAEHAEKEALHFEEPIFDYIRLVGAVKAALQKRNEVRSSYGAAVQDLEHKTAIVTKLLQKTKNQTASQATTMDEKLQLAEADVSKAQERVDDAKLVYDLVTERVLREVQRFKREKLADFKRIILDYIHMQVEYSKLVEEEWNAVLPHLAQIHAESSSPSTSTSNLPSSTANSLIQENYIGSDGGLSHPMTSLSLGQAHEDEESKHDSNTDVML